jgi:hypothetical protein
MLRNLIAAIVLCLLTSPAFCQSTSKWQIAMITEVKPHVAAEEYARDVTSYDVSIRVGHTLYVVLYTPSLGELPPKYEMGHELLVLVEKNTITYNDMLGRSFHVPIEGRGSVAVPKHSR